VAVLEAAWLGLWFDWLGRLPAYLPSTGGTLLPFWVAAGLVLGGHAAGRLALALGREDPAGQARRRYPGRTAAPATRRARLLVAGTGLLAVAAALWAVYGGGRAPWSPEWLAALASGLARNWQPVPPQALSLAAAMYLWRRGIKAGQTAAVEAHEELRRTFYAGLAGMALLVLVAAPGPGRQWSTLEAAEIAGAALLYFAVGLSALALASAQRALRQGRQLGEKRVTLNRYWLSASAGVVVFVLLGAMAAGWLVTPEPIRAVFAVLAPVVNLLGVVLLVLFVSVAAVTLLIAQVVAPVIWRLLQFLTRLPLPQFQAIEPPTFEQLAGQVNQLIDRIPAGRLVLNILAVVLLVAAIGFIFWLALGQLGRRPGAGDDEVRESIASRELIARQLLDLLNRLRPRPPAAGRAYLSLDGLPLDPRVTIRRAYQSMLAWAAETLQEPRAPAQTPGAYALRLSARSPQAGPALAALTAAYLKARYGAQQPTAAEADLAQQAASQIRGIKLEK
jgi:hypothetical protein